MWLSLERLPIRLASYQVVFTIGLSTFLSVMRSADPCLCSVDPCFCRWTRVRLPLCGSPLHTVLVLYTNVGPPLLDLILSTAGLSRVYQRW